MIDALDDASDHWLLTQWKNLDREANGRQYSHDHWSMVSQSLAHARRGDDGSLRLVARRVVP